MNVRVDLNAPGQSVLENCKLLGAAIFRANEALRVHLATLAVSRHRSQTDSAISDPDLFRAAIFRLSKMIVEADPLFPELLMGPREAQVLALGLALLQEDHQLFDQLPAVEPDARGTATPIAEQLVRLAEFPFSLERQLLQPQPA